LPESSCATRQTARMPKKDCQEPFSDNRPPESWTMKDRLLAAAAAIGALGYLYSDYKMPRLELGDPLGPRAFPAIVGLLLLISAVLLMLETRRGQQATVVAATRSGPSHLPVLLGILFWTI